MCLPQIPVKLPLPALRQRASAHSGPLAPISPSIGGLPGCQIVAHTLDNRASVATLTKRGEMPEHLARRPRGWSTKRPAVARTALWLFVLLCTGLAGCGYPSVNELKSELEKLPVPSDWRLADTVSYGSGGDVECVPQVNGPACPMATGYYVVEATPLEAYEQGTEMLVNAGFKFDSGGVEPCDRPAGTSLCSTEAFADDRRIWLQVWTAGSQPSGADIGDSKNPVVSISTWSEGRDS